MKYLANFWLATLCFLCLVPERLYAQCSGGSCGGPSSGWYAPATYYEWRRIDDAPYQRALIKNGKQIGTWDAKAKTYRPRLSPGKWGVACKSPITPPKVKLPPVEKDVEQQLAEVSAARNFGVDMSKIDKGPKYSDRKHDDITRAQAMALVSGKELPQDWDKPHCTIIGGTPEDRRKVIDDIMGNPALADMKANVRLQAYAADDWSVREAGFSCDKGKPVTIYCQSPDGTTLHRQDDYADGAEGLAKAWARINNVRKPDPLYDPGKDKDKRQPDPILPGNIPMPFYVLGGIAAAVLFLPRKGA